MNLINRSIKKVGAAAGLSALLVSSNACHSSNIISPPLENPRVVRIDGPHEVAPGASYSIVVIAEQGNLTPVIEIRRGGDSPITQQTYFLRANYVAAPIPGEENFNISAFSPVNGARHDTTHTIPRR